MIRQHGETIDFIARVPENSNNLEFKGHVAVALPIFTREWEWDIRDWLMRNNQIKDGEKLVGMRFSQRGFGNNWYASVFICKGEVSDCLNSDDQGVRELRIILRDESDVLMLFRKLGQFDIFLRHREIQISGNQIRRDTASVSETESWLPDPDQWH